MIATIRVSDVGFSCRELAESLEEKPQPHTSFSDDNMISVNWARLTIDAESYDRIAISIDIPVADAAGENVYVYVELSESDIPYLISILKARLKDPKSRIEIENGRE